MTKEQKKSGGKREGAGRKADPNAKISIGFRLDRDVVNAIQAQPNQAGFIAQLVREYISKQE